MRKCSRMQSTVQMWHWRNSTSRRTLQLISRRNSIRSTIQLGIVLLVATSALMLPIRLSISSISIWVRWQYCSSSLDDLLIF
ncbi:UNVERIFIED_CONTAM: hypothetical protein GTU68_012055 [Idotea baltica]|nr:hypothetical protein [Idotea baltica]